MRLHNKNETLMVKKPNFFYFEAKLVILTETGTADSLADASENRNSSIIIYNLHA